ncbi:MAG: glycoside hydrolase family 28 protein, partial [Prevotella sp.]|nr:glycoside hydrolase family 28 protein [Prevotella sp.]
MKEVYNSIKAPVFPDRDFLITDFHVSSDTLYTKAINSAIGACHAAGGGRVVIPAGEYVTAPITLRSNVNLHLEEGAVLKFTLDTSLSNIVLTRIEGIDCYNWQPLIYAYGEENIAITGKGTLDGQGTPDSWWSPKLRHNIKLPDGRIGYEKTLLNECLERQDPIDKRIFKGIYGMRPQFINLYRCKNILLEDFTIIRSPFWLIHPLLSENIIVRGVTMNSHGANNDGCDPESCKNVIIENCTLDTGDDCIAIKSGKDADGRRWNIPSENIIVRNCVMKDG